MGVNQSAQPVRITTGDYQTVAARLQIVTELLCEAVDLRGASG
jgi:hypothetical protein